MEHQVYSEQDLFKHSKPEPTRLVDGIATYKVVEGKCTTSTTGNPMVALKLIVWDSQGNQGYVKDWILLTQKFAYKFKSFWISCDHLELYNRGKTEDWDYPGKEGKCKIKWTESKDEKFPSCMKITNYLPPEESTPKTYDVAQEVVQKESVDTPPPMTDDDIPF